MVVVVGSFGLSWAFMACRTNPTRRTRPSARVTGVGDADRGQVVWGNDALLWGLLLDDDTDDRRDDELSEFLPVFGFELDSLRVHRFRLSCFLLHARTVRQLYRPLAMHME